MHAGYKNIVAHIFIGYQCCTSSGTATTLQGEVIRLAGRIANELEGNGGINWDVDFKLMADAFVEYVKQGRPLSVSEPEELERTVKAIK